MPVPFPTLDPETGELVATDYYTVGEVAALLHVSHATVRARIRSGEWRALRIATGFYMTAEHIGLVIDSCTHGGPPEPEPDPGPPRLGIPVRDADLEGMR